MKILTLILMLVVVLLVILIAGCDQGCEGCDCSSMGCEKDEDKNVSKATSAVSSAPLAELPLFDRASQA